MTDAGDSIDKLKTDQGDKKRREEALPERILRRVLEGMGDVVDRRFGRTDERVRNEGRRGRIAPHHLILKVEWGTHSEAPPEILHDLKNEVLAAAIDH